MPAGNMLEAKSNLSRLVEAVKTGGETEIIIARNGRPAARLVAIRFEAVGHHIDIAQGRFHVPQDIDAANNAVGALFAYRLGNNHQMRSGPQRDQRMPIGGSEAVVYFREGGFEMLSSTQHTQPRWKHYQCFMPIRLTDFWSHWPSRSRYA